MSLKSRLEIGRLLRQGQRYSGSSFSVVWQTGESFQYAILVSKRLGSAPTRNRVKRLFREAIRLSLSELTVCGKMLVLPIGNDQEPGFDQLKSDIARIFRKISA